MSVSPISPIIFITPFFCTSSGNLSTFLFLCIYMIFNRKCAVRFSHIFFLGATLRHIYFGSFVCPVIMMSHPVGQCHTMYGQFNLLSRGHIFIVCLTFEFVCVFVCVRVETLCVRTAQPTFSALMQHNIQHIDGKGTEIY